jgi:hypothetical protein
MAKKSKIYIKPSKRGSLRKHLGVGEGEKIPTSKLRIKSTDSPAIRKKKQFAINARKWKHEEGGIQEYALGGWLKDNAQGVLGGLKIAGGAAALIASGGAAAPLVTPLMASGAGDIAGEISKDQAINNQQDMINQQMMLRNRQQYFNNSYIPSTQYTPTFPLGGVIPYDYSNYQPNAELEKAEVFRTPDGQIMRLSKNAPTHDQGGVDMKLPVGTEILGKNKYMGEEFKEIGQKLSKLQSKYNKVLKEGSTPIARRTAKLMLDKVQKEYDDLIMKQEASKLNKQVKSTFPDGGTVVDDNTIKNAYELREYRKLLNDYYINKYPQTKGYIEEINKLPNYNLGKLDEYAGRFNKQYGDLYISPKEVEQILEKNKPGSYQRFNQLTYESLGRNAKQGVGINVIGNIEDPEQMKGVNYGIRSVLHSPISDPTKGESFVPYTFAKGGMVKKCQTGDIVGSFDTDKYTFFNQSPQYNAPYIPQYLTTQGESVSANQSVIPIQTSMNTNNISDSYSPSQPTNNINYGNIASQIGTYAPIAYNLAKGIFGKPEIMEEERYQNPYESQVRSLMSRRRFNVQPLLERNRVAQTVTNRNLRNVGLSAGQVASNLQGTSLGRMRSDAEALSQQQNINNQYLAEQAQTLGTLGQQRAQTRLGIDQMNQQARAVQRSYIPTALSQLQQAAQVNQQMQGQRAADTARVSALNQVLSNYIYDPTTGQYKFKQ